MIWFSGFGGSWFGDRGFRVLDLIKKSDKCFKPSSEGAIWRLRCLGLTSHRREVERCSPTLRGLIHWSAVSQKRCHRLPVSIRSCTIEGLGFMRFRVRVKGYVLGLKPWVGSPNKSANTASQCFRYQGFRVQGLGFWGFTVKWFRISRFWGLLV